MTGANAVRQALSYVVPQLNNSPSTSGFSPAQWVLGQSPDFPGELLGSSLTPVHLGGTFEDELSRRATAKMAIVQADVDQKLRRALLRKYAGNNIALNPGQKCFFWRDSRNADLVKIRWKGPATILMREEDDDGRAKVYWLAYKSQLLRAAPHHVRPEIGKSSEPLADNFQTAKDVVQQLRSRGVTRYLDLNVLNKRRLEDVGTDEEVLDDGNSDLEQPAHRRRLLDSTLIERPPIADEEYSPSILQEDEDLDAPDLGLFRSTRSASWI